MFHLISFKRNIDIKEENLSKTRTNSEEEMILSITNRLTVSKNANDDHYVHLLIIALLSGASPNSED